MPTTVNKISEQIQRLYVRFLHTDDPSPTIDQREIKHLVEQSINTKLKVQTYEGFQQGFVDIPKSSIITYSDVPVVSAGGFSYLDLPADPVNLPLDMGLWEITDTENPYNAYIPIVGQDAILMQGSPEAFLEGQVGYRRRGRRVLFTEDIGQAPYFVAELDVSLLVNDLTQFGGDDLMPISADMERVIIEDVLSMLGLGVAALQELNKSEEQEKQRINE